MNREKISILFKDIQDNISDRIKSDTGQNYLEDKWNYGSGKGGGRTRIFSNGDIEKAGVNFSSLSGNLSEKISNKIKGTGKAFFATGVSVVIHPKNPFVPSIHMNIRYLERNNKRWFGGGIDLTPYYISKKDIIDYHKKLKTICDKYDDSFYFNFKKQCDDYFYIKHRKETRGVGGLFFDNLDGESNKNLNFVEDIGRNFSQIFLTFFNKNNSKKFSNKEKKFQTYRRGRYVEFNLVYDRGTLFGLETNGRIESILMSLPPTSEWTYNWSPEINSEESKLYKFLKPIDWIK